MSDFYFLFSKCELKNIQNILQSYFDHMAFPMDSSFEDKLEGCNIFKISEQDNTIGYVGIIKDVINFFHVIPHYFPLCARNIRIIY